MSGNRRGFTLIELMIGVGLWALVAVCLAGLLQNGVRTWRRMDQATALEQEARVTLEQIASDVRGSLDVPGIDWSDAEGKVSFARIVKFREETPRPRSREAIVRVVYRIDPSGVLRRSQQELSPQARVDPIDTELTNRRTALAWDYAFASPRAALEWTRTWTSTPAHPMPAGVRVSLTLYDGKNEPESFTRTIFVPSRTTLPWTS